METYQKQAIEFLRKTNTTLEIKFLKNDYHFPNDKEKRDIYEITLFRGSRKYTFNFGQDLVNSGFYVQQGVKKTNIDRKYLDSKNLRGLIRSISNICFNSKIDRIHFPTPPDEYNILACLTKDNPGTLEDFCNGFGYNPDSKIHTKIYEAVRDEYLNIIALFNDEEMSELQKIY